MFSTTLQYGYSLAAGDVNSDSRPDLYVMRGTDSAGNNAPDQVYLNDGSGASFTRMSSIPSTSQGTPDSVAPLDYDGNGLTDFLVLNGGGENESGPGPVELIAFFGSTAGSTDPVSGPPTVTGTSPAANATRVASTTDVRATFSEEMDASSITGTTFKLTKKGTTTKIGASVSYEASTDTAKLDPNQDLTRGVTYKAVVTTGARDAAGNPLAQQYRWFFTVG